MVEVRGKKKKKGPDLCTKDGGVREGGRVYIEESVGHSEDGEHETESDCWRICVHLNPERKGDQFDSFFFSSICQTTTASTVPPPPSQPRWLYP